VNTGRLIGGIVCLAVAVLLAVLAFTSPESSMIFMVGDTNVPMAPAIILAAVGLALLISARTADKEDAEWVPSETQVDTSRAREKAALNKRLETIAWGLFLIMLGGFGFVPRHQVPGGLWSIGVGLIMLGLNLTRYFYDIKLSGFTTFLGIISLISGTVELLGVRALEGGILLIILGSYLLVKPWFDRKQLFGKAEQG
jgi:hypothetical protein